MFFGVGPRLVRPTAGIIDYSVAQLKEFSTNSCGNRGNPVGYFHASRANTLGLRAESACRLPLRVLPHIPTG